MFVAVQMVDPRSRSLFPNKIICFSDLDLSVGQGVRYHTTDGFHVGIVTEIDPVISSSFCPIFDVFEILPASPVFYKTDGT
ncbi:MAG: hypothetical protein Q4F31_10825 [Eubacteriales bacterium]|nr:hypothetical protein [Eubacteriales bacterium]